jgi:hypothetical protein
MFRQAGNHLHGVIHWCKVHLGLSGPYTNELHPEDDYLLVETYVRAYTNVNINFPIVHYLVLVSTLNNDFVY